MHQKWGSIKLQSYLRNLVCFKTCNHDLRTSLKMVDYCIKLNRHSSGNLAGALCSFYLVIPIWGWNEYPIIRKSFYLRSFALIHIVSIILSKVSYKQVRSVWVTIWCIPLSRHEEKRTSSSEDTTKARVVSKATETTKSTQSIITCGTASSRADPGACIAHQTADVTHGLFSVPKTDRVGTDFVIPNYLRTLKSITHYLLYFKTNILTQSLRS